MPDPIRLPSVPTDYGSRKELWIRSSLWLTSNEGPLLALSVQDLGYCERVLLEMEGKLAASADMRLGERENLIMECSAHSKLWIFGLYEIVRAFKGTKTPKFTVLANIFHELEVLRMPLAKHEVKRTVEHSRTPHYPTGLWDSTSGRVGWHVFDPVGKTMRTFTRTGIADEFLALTATVPVFAAVPNGGPLGRSTPPKTDSA
jgi:hypothetical protein